MYKSLPVADPSLLNTLSVMSVVDALLSSNSSCTDPLSSSMLYVDWSKLTVGANISNNKYNYTLATYYTHYALLY